MKLTHICIMTNDVVSLTEFYLSILPDAKQEGEGDMYVQFRTECGIIGITSMKLDNRNLFEPNANKSIMLEFEVDDVDAEHDRIKNLGIEIVKPLETQPWGNRSFYFKDPDGNLIDFYMDVE